MIVKYWIKPPLKRAKIGLNESPSPCILFLIMLSLSGTFLALFITYQGFRSRWNKTTVLGLTDWTEGRFYVDMFWVSPTVGTEPLMYYSHYGSPIIKGRLIGLSVTRQDWKYFSLNIDKKMYSLNTDFDRILYS